MNKLEDIMTSNPACCTTQTDLEEVARLMVECDCGEIPVINNERDRSPVGVITDRDICCRTVGQGLNPLTMTVQQCMTSPAILATVEMSLDECCHLMEANQIRRLPVVDKDDCCIGIVSLADIVRNLEETTSGTVVKHISMPRGSQYDGTYLPQ